MANSATPRAPKRGGGPAPISMRRPAFCGGSAVPAASIHLGLSPANMRPVPPTHGVNPSKCVGCCIWKGGSERVSSFTAQFCLRGYAGR